MKTKKQNIVQETHLEKPFEYLIKQESNEIVLNWYQARRYVLDLLNNTLQESESLPTGWHFIVYGDNELLLSVVRHLVLYAHFTNYEEYDSDGKLSCKNRTHITIVSAKNAADIESELQKKEYLCNLPKVCQMTLFGNVKNKDSYMDIAIDVVKDKMEVGAYKNYKRIEITEELISKQLAPLSHDQIFSIDTRKAVCAGETYNLGAVIGNLPYEDIHSVNRYSNALNTFQNKVLDCKINKLIKGEEEEKKWNTDPNVVRLGLSNVFCADSFEIHEKEVNKLPLPKDKADLGPWGAHMNELSRCEHNRWIAEKLLLGYMPLGEEQIFKYEHLFGDDRKAYWKKLKNDPNSPMHIDICSNRDLRRRDPDSMKYDSFLMLAIPLILRDIRKDS